MAAAARGLPDVGAGGDDDDDDNDAAVAAATEPAAWGAAGGVEARSIAQDYINKIYRINSINMEVE